MPIRQEFAIHFHDEGGIFTATREYINNSWSWNSISFYNFSLDGIATINGSGDLCDEEYDDLGLSFQVTKNEKKKYVYLKNSDLKKLCELALSDLSAFKKELCKLAGVKCKTDATNFRTVRATIFEEELGTGEVRAVEYKRMDEGKIAIYRKMLCIYDVLLRKWSLFGRLIQNANEQEWTIEEMYLYQENNLPNGTITEKVHLTKKDVKPFMNDFTLLFDALQNEKFDDVEKILDRLLDLQPSKRAKKSLIYQNRSEGIFLEVNNALWFLNIGYGEKVGKDGETIDAFRKLIKHAIEKNDDRRLKAFCRKVAMFRE